MGDSVVGDNLADENCRLREELRLVECCACEKKISRYHVVCVECVRNMIGKPSAALSSLAEELQRARTKFPGNDLLTIALGEEFGELCQAQLQRKSRDEIRKEALQVACVAIRIYEEGDASLSAVTDDQAKP